MGSAAGRPHFPAEPGAGEDPRYRAIRTAHGHAFWWRSLFIVFWLQAAILWFVALPLLIAARSPQPAQVTVTDVAGLLLFIVGLAFEAVGDHQLRRFKSVPANRGKVLDTGLWRYTDLTVMKLLIVEDDKSLSRSIYDYLKMEGHICEVAQTYHQALNKAADNTYDCIILDIGLPRV